MNPLKALGYRLLRQSERFMKTDMVYAAHGGFWLLFGQAISVLVSLVLAIAFANLIAPEEYGNYKYVLSLAAVIGTFTLTGLGVAVMRAAARGQDGTLYHAFRTTLVWSLGMLIISALGGTYYLLNDNRFLGYALLVIGVASPLIAATSLYRPFLMGKRDFKRASLYGAAQGIVPTLAVLIALLLKAPILLLVTIYFASNIAILAALYARTRRFVENNLKDPDTNRIGTHLSFMSVLSGITGKLDSILIFQLMGGAELALFTVATAIPDTLRSTFKHIDTLALPKFAEKTKNEMKRSVFGKTMLILGGAVLMTFVYVFAAPLLFQTLFPQYLAAIPYTQGYAAIILLSFALASSYFDAQAAIKERYILNITNNVGKIIFTVLGIYFFGLWGAIAARLASRSLNAALCAFIIARH